MVNQSVGEENNALRSVSDAQRIAQFRSDVPQFMHFLYSSGDQGRSFSTLSFSKLTVVEERSGGCTV